MTPGNVCYTAYMESMRLERPYLPRYVLLDVANKAAWEAAANAVSGDLIADNERLRAALEAQLSELMETYPCFGMGGGSKSEERAQAQWEKEHGRQKAFLRTALAPPAPDAVAKYRASIRREALLEAAKLIQKTTPDPLTDEGWSWHGGRMANVEQLEAMAKREGRGRHE